MQPSKLLSTLKSPAFTFKNRVFMAPMTRSRAPQHIATDLMAEYYGQRASAGLIFSEGTQVSAQGIGYISTPGIHSAEQAKGWKKTTDSVHANGGTLFAQLWHVGRVSHPEFHNGGLPVAPSAIAFDGTVFTSKGMQKVVTPHALTIEEIKNTIQDFKKAAQYAKDAGFDGVEIHGANGYLPHQFLEDGSNQRQDEYGGSIENRARFILELFDAVNEVWDANRMSVRLSPRNPFNGMHDSNPEKTYSFVVSELNKRKLGILHFMESLQLPKDVTPLKPVMRKLFSQILLINKEYTKDTAEQVIDDGLADAVSFGTLFLANPDLPLRFEKNAKLNKPDTATFYGGDAKGYTDYPRLDD